MNKQNKKILMLFIEPTPYIVDLLEDGFSDLKTKLDIFFISECVSQQWMLSSHSMCYDVLNSRKKIFHLILNIFLKRKYNLIHIAGWSKTLTVFLIILSRCLMIPVVVETDTPLNAQSALWKKMIKKILYPILFKFPAFFLPGGTRQAQYLEYYGVKQNKMVCAQMTVNINRILTHLTLTEKEKLRIQYGAEKSDMVFLFVGRLLPRKGVRELISAMRLMLETHAKLWIVGSGILEHEVIQAAQQCQNIKYFGRIDGDVLLDIYHAADVFVLAAYWEPWGLVINEAMAAQKAIIVTRTVGCVDDLVSQNNEGLIIAPQNIDALHNAMRFMIDHPDERAQMAKNASRRIASWTLQNEANNIIAAWKQTMDGKRFNVYS